MLSSYSLGAWSGTPRGRSPQRSRSLPILRLRKIRVIGTLCTVRLSAWRRYLRTRSRTGLTPVRWKNLSTGTVPSVGGGRSVGSRAALAVKRVTGLKARVDASYAHRAFRFQKFDTFDKRINWDRTVDHNVAVYGRVCSRLLVETVVALRILSHVVHQLRIVSAYRPSWIRGPRVAGQGRDRRRGFVLRLGLSVPWSTRVRRRGVVVLRVRLVGVPRLGGHARGRRTGVRRHQGCSRGVHGRPPCRRSVRGPCRGSSLRVRVRRVAGPVLGVARDGLGPRRVHPVDAARGVRGVYLLWVVLVVLAVRRARSIWWRSSAGGKIRPIWARPVPDSSGVGFPAPA